jgi:hypothetical protein
VAAGDTIERRSYPGGRSRKEEGQERVALWSRQLTTKSRATETARRGDSHGCSDAEDGGWARWQQLELVKKVQKPASYTILESENGSSTLLR